MSRSTLDYALLRLARDGVDDARERGVLDAEHAQALRLRCDELAIALGSEGQTLVVVPQ